MYGISPKDVKWHDKWAKYKAAQINFYWGARAIYNGQGVFDIIQDRQQMVGGSVSERAMFYDWISSTGLKFLKKMLVDNRISSDTDRDVRLETLEGYYIVASPKASNGYLYIGMWEVPDITFPEDF